ncbi:efflux transporter outer membrane subunit [Cupriavidus basilensis]|uniref:efflux transporter outer membrane subunit n=1 Tax=Cupriavidus basilensis TaxID=68895 RepID=UPI001DDCC72E|nr:efflux transporter outer membrane subunit [Cupriavidus basilensis]NUA30228.1 efflux transporter outer membrane subunit [Cupriavidus basilensis]
MIVASPRLRRAQRFAGPAVSALMAATLAGCANYAGIKSDKHIADAPSYATTQSIPAEQGRWPSADWTGQFGDTQLKALIGEALLGSPSLEKARARVAAATAFSESANASTMPQVGAGYSWIRQRFSESTLIPPPFAGSWQSENKAFVNASYELDLWGKNREALKSAASSLRASEAEAGQVKLTLSSAVARAYNELARLYALHDIVADEVEQRREVLRVTNRRVTLGLDTEVEKRTAEASLASSEVALSSLDGSIQRTRYQLGALLGQGPDRGLAMARPALGAGDEVRLPANLPADLVSRRPDIVAARWRVDATLHDIKVAKAEFYPFSALPAQNATGNWIKVVQRLPVRVQLDPAELREHPLQIGLSMQVDVQTRTEDGSHLASGSRSGNEAPYRTTYRTDVFQRHGEQADREIAQIIAQNRIGTPGAGPAAEHVAQHEQKAGPRPARRNMQAAPSTSVHRPSRQLPERRAAAMACLCSQS